MEMLVFGVVALVVVGPKELPMMFKTSANMLVLPKPK
jgi:Sec-independent protein translocase protein TatA